MLQGIAISAAFPGGNSGVAARSAVRP